MAIGVGCVAVAIIVFVLVLVYRRCIRGAIGMGSQRLLGQKHVVFDSR